MSTTTPNNVPSNPRPNILSKTPETKKDAWREDLKTLTDRSGLTFISEEHWDSQRFWWSFYYLTNPDGSKRHYLGSGCGTNQTVAKEYAAMQSYGTLTTLINTWIQTATENSAASTSAAISTYMDPGAFWEQELKSISKEKSLRFVCEELQDSQGTWWATYHLINQDGSKHYQLGSRGASAFNIAKEHAAHDVVETLNYLIAAWSQPGTAASSSGAGGSSS